MTETAQNENPTTRPSLRDSSRNGKNHAGFHGNEDAFYRNAASVAPPAAQKNESVGNFIGIPFPSISASIFGNCQRYVFIVVI